MFVFDDVESTKRVGVHMQWGTAIPLRDGTQLSGTLYLPVQRRTTSPAILTMTPYVSQMWHDFAVYFAANGYPFLVVDVRGRGNSQGQFSPFIQEAEDGFDCVEWLAHHAACDGRVAMWGGSYAGYAQWAAASRLPPHLSTIVPVASPCIGIDMPLRSNIFPSYLMQWLTLVAGRTSQDKLFFNNEAFWGTKFRQWRESGTAFKQLDSFLGNPCHVFQEWVSHPELGAYWDRYNPTSEQYARLDIPILTITGFYDGDQPGALMHFREHLKQLPVEKRTRHYLVIGPWDHFGTRTPKAEFCGLKVGPASLIDIQRLHVDWYRWTLQDGPKPKFLQKNVAYYVTGSERWRYADTLEEITAQTIPFYLQSTSNPVDVLTSGTLTRSRPGASTPDHYVYDPKTVHLAELEALMDPENVVDQRFIYAATGQQLVYHTAPFEQDAEISGFFKFSAWIAIDQPDTDFRAAVYEVSLDGSSVLLSVDQMRARFRESLRRAALVRTSDPLRYDFQSFTFVARLIRKGCRLRLVFGPLNSIYSEKNYNSGGVVAEESIEDARVVTVTLHHDEMRPSALYVPFGRQ